MDQQRIAEKFAKIGARARLRPPRRAHWVEPTPRFDVRKDRRGEYFEIVTGDSEQLDVLDVQAKARHLLMMVRSRDNQDIDKAKLLCGHDERHWFVAAVPSEGVSDVATAFKALRPAPVQEALDQKRVRRDRRSRRHNEAFVRQGEWFFVPAPDLTVDDALVLPDEPIQRGRSKPHMCEFLYRQGGQKVYVCRRHPNGLTESQYSELIRKEPRARNWGWKTRVREPRVYVRGRVTHPDHSTVHLKIWHRVHLSLQGAGVGTMAFLD
jgi:hypothetical protein